MFNEKKNTEKLPETTARSQSSLNSVVGSQATYNETKNIPGEKKVIIHAASSF